MTRPLMSVGKICDEGHKVEFDKEKAVIKHQDGSLSCNFSASARWAVCGKDEAT